MVRRQAFALLIVGTLCLTAGCGFILGQESLSFAATPATVSDQALEDSGYEEVTVEERVATRNFSAAGETRTVEVTNQLAQYERQVDLGPLGSKRAAVFVTFTSPEVDVLGQSFNPIADMSEREVLSRFETQYESISVGDHVGNRTVESLGSSRTIEQFEGSAQLTESSVDVYIDVAKFKHEGEYIVVVAIYPQRLGGESATVDELTGGLQHTPE